MWYGRIDTAFRFLLGGEGGEYYRWRVQARAWAGCGAEYRGGAGAWLRGGGAGGVEHDWRAQVPLFVPRREEGTGALLRSSSKFTRI